MIQPIGPNTLWVPSTDWSKHEKHSPRVACFIWVPQRQTVSAASVDAKSKWLSLIDRNPVSLTGTLSMRAATYTAQIYSKKIISGLKKEGVAVGFSLHTTLSCWILEMMKMSAFS